MTAKELADLFRKMADRIERNAEEPFGGAAVIIAPPDQQGADPSAIVLLKLDPQPEPSVFWGEITSRANAAVAELTDRARQNTAFRR